MIRQAMRAIVRAANGDDNAAARGWHDWLQAGGDERMEALLEELRPAAGSTPQIDAVASDAVAQEPDEERRAQLIAELVDARENPSRARDLKAEWRTTFGRVVYAIFVEEIARYRAEHPRQ